MSSMDAAVETSNSSSTVPDWSCLPEAALVAILQQINTQHRLARCALVNRSWRTAAKAATSSVAVDVAEADSSKALSLQTWVAANSRSFTSLSVRSSREAAVHPDFAQMPCAKLRSLRLEYCSIKRTPLAHAGILDIATQLQQLSLIRCSTDDASTLQQSLPCSLQELQIEGPLHQPFVSAQSHKLLPAFFLQHLTRCAGLTCLALSNNLSDASLQHLSSLSKLKRLSLQWPDGNCRQLGYTALHGLSALTDLTCLVLHDAYLAGETANTSWAQLPRQLHLDLLAAGETELAAVSMLTQLQHLCVNNSAPVSAHLRTLPQLQALTHFSLGHSVFDSAPAEQFSALTASSNLRELRFSHPICTQWGYLGPIWDYALPTGKSLPHFTSMVADYGIALPLRRLAQVCPRLRHLQFNICSEHSSRGLLPAKHPVTALLQLQHLTSLELWGFDYHPVSADVPQLTGLRQLRIRTTADLRPTDVVSLTGLQQLVHLELRHLNHSCYQTGEAEQRADAANTQCHLPASGRLCLHNQVRVNEHSCWSELDMLLL